MEANSKRRKRENVWRKSTIMIVLHINIARDTLMLGSTLSSSRLVYDDSSGYSCLSVAGAARARLRGLCPQQLWRHSRQKKQKQKQKYCISFSLFRAMGGIEIELELELEIGGTGSDGS
eukprot:scaffold160107_cov53-Attheya_sp.AAC.4